MKEFHCIKLPREKDQQWRIMAIYREAKAFQAIADVYDFYFAQVICDFLNQREVVLEKKRLEELKNRSKEAI